MCIQPHGTALQVTVTDMMYSLVRWKTKTTANFSLIRRDRIQLLKSDFRRYTNEKLLQIFRIKTQKKTNAGVNNQESLQRTDEMLNLKKKDHKKLWQEPGSASGSCFRIDDSPERFCFGKGRSQEMTFLEVKQDQKAEDEDQHKREFCSSESACEMFGSKRRHVQR